MGLRSGSILNAWDFLSSGDYIRSSNGFFFATMQGDGNFCVYYGSGPSDNQGFLWGTGSAQGNGAYFAIMQDDGNFCVYKGTGPSDNHGVVWAAMGHHPPGAGNPFFAIMQDDGHFVVYKGTGPSDNRGVVWASDQYDPVVKVDPISRIDYDLGDAQILSTSFPELLSETLQNQGSQASQTSQLGGSQTFTETQAWSDSLAIQIGVQTSFESEVPFVEDEKVTISEQITNTYTWSGSTTTSTTWTFNVGVTVPPMSNMKATVAVTSTTISVPYTLTGTVVLRSGKTMTGQVRGTYTGTNSHDVVITYVQLSPGGQEVTSTTQPLNAIGTVNAVRQQTSGHGSLSTASVSG